MSCMIRCIHCGRHFILNPRVKDQRYCGRKECQRARKTLWQREKMRTDPEYQTNQRESHRSWRERNPGYWKEYRIGHPEYAMRNRILQRHRDKRRLPYCAGRKSCKDGRVNAKSLFDSNRLATLAKKDSIDIPPYLLLGSKTMEERDD